MPDPQAKDVVSSHVTSEDLVLYARSDDGGLEVWLRPWGQAPQQLTGTPSNSDRAAQGAPLRVAC